jgi:hypothetical protein
MAETVTDDVAGVIALAEGVLCLDELRREPPRFKIRIVVTLLQSDADRLAT